jgi:hypothetical protein
MTTSSDLSDKSRAQSKIQFLETQLTSLDHYLPETFEYLIRELDVQKRLLAELEVQETFNAIDATIDQKNELLTP